MTKLETTETVQCLECSAVYSKPRGGGTISTNPGCPHCGYLGWADVEPASAAQRRVRFDADHPRTRSGRPH